MNISGYNYVLTMANTD